MSDDYSNKVCLVVDNGFFLPVARRLAQEFGEVLYNTPWEKSYPTLNDGVLGCGYPKLVRCDDIWLVKDRVDLFVFPDLYHMGTQMELRSQGRRVWGAGRGMKLEINREFFVNKLRELGLAVAPHKVVVGLEELAEYLRDRTNQFIKVSKWRGSWETKQWRSWEQDSDKLHVWAVKLGGVKNVVPFLVFDEIKTELEIGADTYCVHGQWPATMLHGIEKKDEAYFAAVTKKSDMPDELTHIMEAFSPFLRECGYSCQWSMEVRVTDDEAYFIDATTRGGLPSTASFLSATNVADIIWHGAGGDLVEIDYGFNFAAECLVKVKGEPNAWQSLIVPDELDPVLNVSECCLVGDKTWFPTNGHEERDEVGWLGSTGETPKETAGNMNALADQLPDGASACVESLADVLREIISEQEEGIHFTDEPLPDPSVVLEPSA